jgi:hypothetical protein
MAELPDEDDGASDDGSFCSGSTACYSEGGTAFGMNDIYVSHAYHSALAATIVSASAAEWASFAAACGDVILSSVEFVP